MSSPASQFWQFAPSKGLQGNKRGIHQNNKIIEDKPTCMSMFLKGLAVVPLPTGSSFPRGPWI